MEKRQFTVYGVVQGVGFRYFTCREAEKIGVTGSVKNLSDGSVLVVAEGSLQQLTLLRDWLQKGPPHPLRRPAALRPRRDRGP